MRRTLAGEKAYLEWKSQARKRKVFLGGVYLLAVRGALMTTPRSRHAWAVSLAVAGYLWFASGGPHSLSRFRHPIMPIMCALAGAGLAARKDRQ